MNGQAWPPRLRSPIGVPGLAGKEPAVIAVAVAAELLGLVAAEQTPVGPDDPEQPHLGRRPARDGTPLGRESTTR